nr:MAG TPA: hypothetical protein [Caudoviricetes sp.]DAL84586.1 MAG TPA: hypothetical protein [Caudoviricetes sp.]
MRFNCVKSHQCNHWRRCISCCWNRNSSYKNRS